VLFNDVTAAASAVRPVVYTCVAMLAFAGNSIICRLALRDGAIDPATFTTIRLLAGAIALLLIFSVARRNTSFRSHGSWLSALVLFLYAVAFSFAYIAHPHQNGLAGRWRLLAWSGWYFPVSKRHRPVARC